MTDTEIGLQRFENWKRWACGGECAMILRHYYPYKAAVCGNYLPEAGDVWEDERPIPVDVKDAVEVERLITRVLPHHLAKAVRYWFTGRPRIIGIPEKVIVGWVDQAAREIQCRRFHVID